MTLTQKIAAELERRWEAEGNGATITMKNGKQYNCWAQEDGSYLITDQTTIWQPETFSARANSLQELAETITRIANK